MNQLNPTMPQNEANPRVMHTHNTFPMSYDHPLTCRFGDETPFFVFDSEAGDKVPFNSFHDLDTLTLSQRFKSKLNMHKTYFSIPYRAILPNTWDLFYTNPTHGDDVPDDVFPVMNNVLKFFSDYVLAELINEATKLNNAFAEDEMQLYDYTRFMRLYFIIESHFSDASLLSYLGCKLNRNFHLNTIPSSFEDFSSRFMLALENVFQVSSYITITTDSPSRYFIITEPTRVNIRAALEFMRDNSDFKFVANPVADFESVFNMVPDIPYQRMVTDELGGSSNVNLDFSVNYSRCFAYQLAYFHFLTNDKVDFIYSADLYRNMMFTIITSSTSNIAFEYNGNHIVYDAFSGRWINKAFSDFVNPNISSTAQKDAYIYLSEMLSIRKSLKFGDYFTGSRPTPLAVGDVNAPVVGNGVSAIDITKNVLAQRFLNAVNKTGRKLSEYMKGIRGVNIMPSPNDPRFLARDTCRIGTQNIENTGDNQGNIVSLLRAEQSNFAFEAEFNEPGIILGLVSFSVPRVYSKTIDRFFFKKNRDDFFNPYFQNIGDQEIYVAEKNGNKGLQPFSYTLRNMEYKQRFNQASGGVVDHLKGWYFIADNQEGEDNRYTNISPDFIRSHNVDFDRFYESLTGLTLSSYFHFIINFENTCTPNRNMEYSPTIL